MLNRPTCSLCPCGITLFSNQWQRHPWWQSSMTCSTKVWKKAHFSGEIKICFCMWSVSVSLAISGNRLSCIHPKIIYGIREMQKERTLHGIYVLENYQSIVCHRAKTQHNCCPKTSFNALSEVLALMGVVTLCLEAWKIMLSVLSKHPVLFWPLNFEVSLQQA